MDQYFPFISLHWQRIVAVSASLLLGVAIEKWLSTKSTHRIQLTPTTEQRRTTPVNGGQRKETHDQVDRHDDDDDEDGDDEKMEEDEDQPKVAEDRDLPHIKLNYHKPSAEESLDKSLKFYQLMNLRRSVRDISADPVSLDVINNIILTAGTCQI